MKKSVWIFLLIVLLPAVVLGWLALRSADEQRFILERRTAALYQTEADAVATAVREAILIERRDFAEAVRRMIAEKSDTKELARDFPKLLPDAWKRKAVGFALGPGGKIIAPTAASATTNKEWAKFLWDNSPFLTSAKPAEVYPVQSNYKATAKISSGRTKNDSSLNVADSFKMEAPNVVSKAIEKIAPSATVAAKPKAMPAAGPLPEKKAVGGLPNTRDEAKPDVPPEAVLDNYLAKSKDIMQSSMGNQAARSVRPQELENDTSWSAIMPATAEFTELTKDDDEGMVARFVQDKLDLIFWLRPPEDPSLIFGCLVESASLRDEWPTLLKEHAASARDDQPERIIALLDDKARPVATLPASASGIDWKTPLVASEIGEVFPHWEAAIYLARPDALAASARGEQRTFTFLIAGAIALIVFGGWLVAADVRRQLALAQQKTDFVSNVSHELKTPLTSIRMFAELMHDRPQPLEKQSQYLRIITVESERLTRLINNVLDFAKLERKQRHFEKKPFDFHATIDRVWEGHAMHLRDAGFTAEWVAAPPPYDITGDEDALAQVLVNLLSNAEKYSADRKEIELHTWIDDGLLSVSVLDRGLGVPRGEEGKIFEAFYRAHDSLSSGIQGSGLGLTLARQIAVAHDARITYESREGGGSRFTLIIPLRTSQP